VKALDWNRHDKHIYDKVTDWFTVIGKQLNDPAILPENVYNMDETRVLLSVLSSLKILVGKDDLRNLWELTRRREMAPTPCMGTLSLSSASA
jgi:hypothetical protein